MSRPLDLLGKYVVWPNAAQISAGTVAPAHGPMIAKTDSVPLSLRVYSVGVAAPPGVPGGAHLVSDAIPWAFTFLKYQDGGVTEERLSSSILTGAMSGCYTFRYDFNGITYIAHVGSGATPATTLAAKQNWKRYASNANLRNIEGVDSFYDADVVQQVMAELPGVPYNKVLTYHYYDGVAVHKILLAETANVGPNLWKVVRVEKLRSSSWGMIKLAAKFRGV